MQPQTWYVAFILFLLRIDFKFSKHSYLFIFFFFEERVCDTLVDLEEDKTQRDECINVPSLVCTTEERTVFEKVIFLKMKFSCSKKAAKF